MDLKLPTLKIPPKARKVPVSREKATEVDDFLAELDKQLETK